MMKLRKSSIRLLALSGFYILFLVIGASVFSAIEGPQERELVKEMKDLRRHFLENNQKCLSGVLMNSHLAHCRDHPDEDLEKFIFAIVRATNRGVSAIRNVTMSEPNWSFGQSMFFAGTVLTTIGYGRVTPLSDAGKAFCILFSLIGIPLTLILFSALVERLMVPTKILLYFLFRKLGHLYKVLHIQILHLFIVICCVLVFMVIIPAGIYTGLEPKWNYLDAFYYCFISLTTIGLGDYIPGDSPDQELRAFYKVATTCYLFIGLIFMMLMLAVLYDIPELNLGFHFYMKSDGQDDEHASLRRNADGPKYTKQVDDDQPDQQYTRSYQQDPGPGITEQ